MFDSFYNGIMSMWADVTDFFIDTFGTFIDGKILSFFLTVFTIALVYRFLLKPLLGGGLGSDGAKDKDKDGEE